LKNSKDFKISDQKNGGNFHQIEKNKKIIKTTKIVKIDQIATRRRVINLEHFGAYFGRFVSIWFFLNGGNFHQIPQI
jgi:protein associated with RNAse G/E